MFSYDKATQKDLEILKSQLDRVPRGVVGIAARCVCGNPAVVVTAPRLEDGSPFPTTFYLTLPSLTKALSHLEANQVMSKYQEELLADSEQKTAYEQAHAAYIQARNAVAESISCPPVPEIDNISAGGMPERVKCLHALAGHALAAGAGVNPIGDRALKELAAKGMWQKDRCYC